MCYNIFGCPFMIWLILDERILWMSYLNAFAKRLKLLRSLKLRLKSLLDEVCLVIIKLDDGSTLQCF